MIVIARWFGLGLAALVLVSPARAEHLKLDEYLETVRAQYMLPALAAAVVKDGEVIAAGAVGTRVYGADIPVTIDDRFHLGSDTKAMTATLAGMMVEEGRLGWDSTVGEVLGKDIHGMNPKLAAVTLEQLLSHSSGIPTDTEEMIDLYFNTDAFSYNPDELRLRAIDAWKANEPKVPEESPFQYANFGYLIAGALIEKVAGRPWEELIVERIFEPLGLETAGLGAQATPGRLDAPVGHRVDDAGKVSPMLWGAAADAPAMIGPAGTVHMSVLDFARWAAWNAGKGKREPALVEPATLARLHQAHVRTPHRKHPPVGTPQDGEYGLGWGIVKFDWADRSLLTHNGSNGMNLAKVLIDPDDDLGIVVMTNFPEDKAEAATAEILQHLYEEYGPK
ncbi:MAG TPA: serine hydrolase domain-containing protein [Geminicoccaceae bacterium]|jgi:CubicO group peptidase (beta-lactamase class C family)|nr:serine hydrolase domain-containing protein [Geminicoccaceae bacterium]